MRVSKGGVFEPRKTHARERACAHVLRVHRTSPKRSHSNLAILRAGGCKKVQKYFAKYRVEFREPQGNRILLGTPTKVIEDTFRGSTQRPGGTKTENSRLLDKFLDIVVVSGKIPHAGFHA